MKPDQLNPDTLKKGQSAVISVWRHGDQMEINVVVDDICNDK